MFLKFYNVVVWPEHGQQIKTITTDNTLDIIKYDECVQKLEAEFLNNEHLLSILNFAHPVHPSPKSKGNQRNLCVSPARNHVVQMAFIHISFKVVAVSFNLWLAIMLL